MLCLLESLCVFILLLPVYEPSAVLFENQWGGESITKARMVTLACRRIANL